MANDAPEDFRITEEAADWLVELKASGASRHAEFFEWVRRSPEHVREFLAVTGLAGKLKGIDPQRRIDVSALLGEGGAEIVRLLPTIAPSSAIPRPQANERRMAWKSAAGLAAIALAGGALWLLLKPEVYVTRVGEQRSVALSDGSLMYLNTGSKVQVEFSEGVREIELLAGEALFTVQRDAARPFRVRVGSTTVQAVGTQFNVYRHINTGTTVSVIEGAVLAGPVRLGAGEQANVRQDGAVAKQTVADIENAVAWRQRQLVFRKTPLTEVAAEFNRYNQRQIMVDERAAQERQITGVFAADRPESLVLFVKKDAHVSVRQNKNGWTIEGLMETASIP